MKNRAKIRGKFDKSKTVELQDVEEFLRHTPVERFEVLRTLRHEASLLSGGGLGPMAGLYFAALTVSLPLVALLTVQDDKSSAVPLSLLIGSVLLIFGLYLTGQVISGQRKYAQSATRLAFYEEAVRQELENSKSEEARLPWLKLRRKAPIVESLKWH
jgi:hypothetical protein